MPCNNWLLSLSDRRWFRRLLFFYKSLNRLTAIYLYDLVPPLNTVNYSFRSKRIYQTLAARTGRFQNTFYPYCGVSHWNNLNEDLRNMTSVSSFKSVLLKFIRPKPNPIYNIHDSVGITFLNRLRVGFSHLREHKFRHNFLDTDYPFCNCRSNAIETTEHYLLHCPSFYSHRNILFDSLHRNNISL